jgi:hypothetical protein
MGETRAAAKPRRVGTSASEGAKGMDAGGGSWGIITILGPLLLGAVILWALLRNRRAGPADIDKTEQGTREVYREEEEARRRGDDGRA